MQAAAHRDGDDFMPARLNDVRELADAFGIAALREADEEFSANAKNVAAFEHSGERDVRELAVFRELLPKCGGLAATAFDTHWQNHGDFIEHDGRVFHKHRIRKFGLGGQRDDARAKFPEKRFVGLVLLACPRQINSLAIDEGKLATRDGRTDAAGDGGEHEEREKFTRKPTEAITFESRTLVSNRDNEDSSAIFSLSRSATVTRGQD